MVAALQPLGIRNNNPGNLKFDLLSKWQGLAVPPSDGTFFVFIDAIHGIRAIARTLIAYQDKHGCKTISDFITRWAPSAENDTSAYIAFVALYMKVTATTPIDVHEYVFLRPLVEAIIQHENGAVWSSYYSSDQLDKALVLAGVEPATKPLATTPQVVTGTVAVVATIAPSLLDQINQMHSVLQPYASANPTINTVCGVLAIAAILCGMYAKYRERQKGIS